jgi:hypothetical protein
VIGRRVRGRPLVSSCATGRRCTCALIRRRTRRPSLCCSARRVSRSSPPTGGATPAAGTTAHLLIAVADDQCVEPALSVAAGDSPLPNCVTLVVRGLRTRAGRPKSCDHIS